MAEYRKIEVSTVVNLLNRLDEMSKDVDDMLADKVPLIYSNKDVCDLLGISSKLLMRYRSQGLLPYHRCDDKYWYTQADVDNFTRKTRC